jgi:hypothetical protein
MLHVASRVDLCLYQEGTVFLSNRWFLLLKAIILASVVSVGFATPLQLYQYTVCRKGIVFIGYY